MKKYTIFLVIVILILVIIFAPNVQAGKPKSTEYPPIDTTFEIQSYPNPLFQFPGDPPLNKGYVWGMYFTDEYRWFVSKYTANADPDAIVRLCIAQENPYYQICFRHRNGYDESLQYIGYQDGMSWYQSIPMRSIPVSPCGFWGAIPDTSNWNGELMELHQPNWYYVPCIVWDNPRYLPFVPR